MREGTLFVVTGPSGVGKGTVLQQVFATTDRLYYSVSMTTRPPRETERHGVNYHFCDESRARQMIAEGLMLEYAEYAGHLYGTPAGPVDEKLAEGRDVILEIEVQGALQVKARRPGAVLVFVAPPGFEELERRLRGRGTENAEKVRRRLDAAREEYRKIGEFEYVVVNDSVLEAADELRAIILACRCKTEKRMALLAF